MISNYLKQTAKEQGYVLDDRCILMVDDVKHIASLYGKTHGELIKVLEDFYEEKHEEIYQALVEELALFLNK